MNEKETEAQIRARIEAEVRAEVQNEKAVDTTPVESPSRLTATSTVIAPKKGGRYKKDLSSAAVSIAVHILFFIAAGSFVALRHFNKPQAQFLAEVLDPNPKMQPRKLQMKVKVKDLQKRSSRPKLSPRIAVKAPSAITLPEIPPTPKVSKTKAKRNFATFGAAGFGQGIGGGEGMGAGGGIGGTTFFGIETQGNMFAYLVDFSLSMKGKKDEMMREELTNSIEELSYGVNVCIICFSGPSFILGEDANGIREDWNNGRGKKGGKKGWHPKNGRFPSDPEWVKLDAETKPMILEWIKTTPLTLGTDWMNPFQMIYDDLRPLPDTIYFMTDGRPQISNELEVTEAVRKWNRSSEIPIYAIALMEPQAEVHMKKLADDSGGEFRIIQ